MRKCFIKQSASIFLHAMSKCSALVGGHDVGVVQVEKKILQTNLASRENIVKLPQHKLLFHYKCV